MDDRKRLESSLTRAGTIFEKEQARGAWEYFQKYQRDAEYAAQQGVYACQRHLQTAQMAVDAIEAEQRRLGRAITTVADAVRSQTAGEMINAGHKALMDSCQTSASQEHDVTCDRHGEARA